MMENDYIGIEGKCLDAVADGCCLPFMVALKLGIKWETANAVMNQLVRKGLLRKIEQQDFLGRWYEFEERLP